MMIKFEDVMSKHGFESTLRDVYHRRLGEKYVGYIVKIHFAYSGYPEAFSWNLNVLGDDKVEAPVRHGRTANPAAAVRQLLIAAGQPLPDPVTGMSINDHIYEEVMAEAIRIGGWLRESSDDDAADLSRVFDCMKIDSADRVDYHVRRNIATHENAKQITVKSVAATEAFWTYLADVLEESATFREGLTVRIQRAMEEAFHGSLGD